MLKHFSYIIILFSLGVQAQSPHGFNYQAMPRMANGDIIKDQEISIKISIINGNISSDDLYSEVHHVKTNSFGLVNLIIGKGSFVTSDFETIDWSKGPFFIKVEIDPDGGTQYYDMGTTQILSVPFSMYAQKSGNGISDGDQIIKGTKTFVSPIKAVIDGTIVLNENADRIPGALRWNGTDFQGFDGENWISLTAGGGEVEEDSVSSWECGDNLVDSRDGNSYATVKIGSQCWMQDNLNYDNGNGSYKGSGVYNRDTVGMFYSWAGAMNIDQIYNTAEYNIGSSRVQGACPTGWHIPSHDEYVLLESMPGINGLSLTQGGSSNFEAGLFGFVLDDGAFENYDLSAAFWTSTETDNLNAMKRIIFKDEEGIGVFQFEKTYGFSIRCVKD